MRTPPSCVEDPGTVPAPGRGSPGSAAVVGAGIAGLVAAYRLAAAGVRVRVFEASQRCGGPMLSRRAGGHLFELGPNTVPSTAPHLGRLIDDLGLRDEVTLSRPVAGRRLVWRRGRLHALPEKPPQLLTCSAIGPLARLRLLAEPLVPPRRGEGEETLLDFGRRRLGRGATAGMLDPFITGVFAGRLDQLGVDAVPRLRQWELEHGSLFKALRSAQKQRNRAATRTGPAPLISFPDGLETLPRRLVDHLGGAVETGCPVTAIERRGRGFRVRYRRGDGHGHADVETVVIATPADAAAELLPGQLDPADAAFLAGIEHPFVATVGLGYRRSDIEDALDAFGLLVASDSRLGSDADVLGVLFPSSIFEQRAPAGRVTLTVMIGGARDPGAASLDDEALVRRARAALLPLLGARGEPSAVELMRWPRAIPQYFPGHSKRVAELRRRLAVDGGLAVAGNYLDGVGVEGAVASAEAAAAALLREEPAGEGRDDRNAAAG